MVTYIYFVKCPNCEDEPFDFFDEAKGYAMGCLSQKPVITQTEVCRNDFGECTDSADLGQVWSWEDECEPEAEPITFSKDDINTAYDPDNDPEFQDDDFFAINAEDSTKPIPEGMTIEQLVEEMEENEDTVECTLCQDLFDKSECRKELNLGWLCRRCADDLTARGEGPVFKEDNYWDFLDEDAEPHDLGNEYDGGYPATQTWVCYFDGADIGTVEAATEDEALEKMQREYPEYPYGERKHDDCWWVEPAADNALDLDFPEV